MHKVLVNYIVKLAWEKSVVKLTDRPDMTIAVDWDVKHQPNQIIWASSRETLSLGVVNNKGANQPAHLRSLISAFVIRLLESIII